MTIFLEGIKNIIWSKPKIKIIKLLYFAKKIVSIQNISNRAIHAFYHYYYLK